MAEITKKEMKSIIDTFHFIKKMMESDGFHVSEIGLDPINEIVYLYSILPYKVKYEWKYTEDPLYLYMGTDADGYLEYESRSRICENPAMAAKWLYNPTSLCWHDMTKKKGCTPSITFLMDEVYEILDKLKISDNTEIWLKGSNLWPENHERISLYVYLETHD